MLNVLQIDEVLWITLVVAPAFSRGSGHYPIGEWLSDGYPDNP
jgi:hypothetical protein